MDGQKEDTSDRARAVTAMDICQMVVMRSSADAFIIPSRVQGLPSRGKRVVCDMLFDELHAVLHRYFSGREDRHPSDYARGVASGGQIGGDDDVGRRGAPEAPHADWEARL